MPDPQPTPAATARKPVSIVNKALLLLPLLLLLLPLVVVVVLLLLLLLLLLLVPFQVTQQPTSLSRSSFSPRGNWSCQVQLAESTRILKFKPQFPQSPSKRLNRHK